jgi:hypothetical protein
MIRFLKAAVIWFMLLALPMQGVAAAMATSCASNHHKKTAEQELTAAIHSSISGRPAQAHRHHHGNSHSHQSASAPQHDMHVMHAASLLQHVASSGERAGDRIDGQIYSQVHSQLRGEIQDHFPRSLSSSASVDVPAELQTDIHHADVSCSACAACCVGAAAPPLAVTPSTNHENSPTLAPPPDALHTGFIPAGLERPPRLS